MKNFIRYLKILIILFILQLLEFFGTGTAVVISPITSINFMGQILHLPTMDHEKPVHRDFYKMLTKIQYGYVDHPWASIIS